MSECGASGFTGLGRIFSGRGYREGNVAVVNSGWIDVGNFSFASGMTRAVSVLSAVAPAHGPMELRARRRRSLEDKRSGPGADLCLS